jgi:hypothetical protein
MPQLLAADARDLWAAGPLSSDVAAILACADGAVKSGALPAPPVGGALTSLLPYGTISSVGLPAAGQGGA